MLQALLEDRFQLRAHRETKSLPVYALALAKNGPKLQKAQDAEKPGVAARGGRLEFRKMPIAAFVNTLANLLDNPVLDKTGIQGAYDFTLEWAGDDVPGNSAKPLTGGQSGPSLFTAIEDQLGLKLTAEKAPAEVFVIDRATKPSGN